MQKKSKYRVAVFFAILFMALMSAPTIILSFDDSVDVSNFYSISEEEEESENLKLVIENTIDLQEDVFTDFSNTNYVGYTFKTYPKPHLNLISPPPEQYIL